MSYESKIYVVERSKFSNFAPVIASLDLCKMGYDSGFHQLFTHEIDYDVYIDSHDEPTTEDRYGDHLKDASLNDVLSWSNKRLNVEKYRRFWILYSLLNSFAVGNGWDIERLRVIHYGY